MKINRQDDDEKSNKNLESFIVISILFMAMLIRSSQVEPLQSINVSSYSSQKRKFDKTKSFFGLAKIKTFDNFLFRVRASTKRVNNQKMFIISSFWWGWLHFPMVFDRLTQVLQTILTTVGENLQQTNLKLWLIFSRNFCYCLKFNLTKVLHNYKYFQASTFAWGVKSHSKDFIKSQIINIKRMIILKTQFARWIKLLCGCDCEIKFPFWSFFFVKGSSKNVTMEILFC